MLANANNITLKSEAPSVTELMVPWRRRSRLRRILHAVRTIRRCHPQLGIQYLREHMNVYVFIKNEADLLLFQLMWPQDLPQWIRQ